MKRMIAIVLVILTVTAAFAGCSSVDTGMTGTTTEPVQPHSGTYDAPAYDPGAGTPSANEDGMINRDHAAEAEDDSMLDEFGDDMRDMAEDAGDAMKDAVGGRTRQHSQSGTGMTGGR